MACLLLCEALYCSDWKKLDNNNRKSTRTCRQVATENVVQMISSQGNNWYKSKGKLGSYYLELKGPYTFEGWNDLEKRFAMIRNKKMGRVLKCHVEYLHPLSGDLQ